MINLDGTQTVKDVCNFVALPDDAIVYIHFEFGSDIFCKIDDATYCNVVYRMRSEYDGETLVLHLFTY